MSTQKPGKWVSALMTRFEEQLPCRIGPQTHHTRINVQQNKESLIHISKWKFSLVISGLTKTLTNINEMRPQSIPDFERDYHESLLIVLDTLEKCLSSQDSEAPKYDDVMNVKLLLKEICQYLDMPTNLADSSSSKVLQIRSLASKVLFALSVNNFNAVFSRISGRLQELSVSSEESTDHTDIELIQHINVNLARLTKLLQESIAKFRSLRKTAQHTLMISLEKAMWNWMDTHPNEFTELQSMQNEELSRCCDSFFDLLDNCAEGKTKHRISIWPLQLMLLILTPKVLEEIYNADTGAPCSAKHVRKKHLIDSMKRALGHHGSKDNTQAAAVTCVKLCKAATYVNILDSNNVIFSLVQTVINELKNLLFNQAKPFSRGAGNLKDDIDLMIDCFLANFRINPHNNDTLKVSGSKNLPKFNIP